jgi:hypothetical protein
MRPTLGLKRTANAARLGTIAFAVTLDRSPSQTERVVLLKVEIGVTARVPDRHYLHRGRVAPYAIVEIVLNFAQQDAAHAGKRDIRGDRP